MRQEKWTLAVAVVVLAAVAGLMACSNEAPPTGPSNITIVNTNTNTQGGGSGPGASPSPGAGGELPPGSRVAIFMFGQSCPSGVAVEKNGTRSTRVGCTSSWTCTPKGPDGTDLPSSVHGPNAAFAVVAGSERVRVSRTDNPFNLDMTALAVGEFTVSCTVKGVTGTVDGAVLAATSSSEVEAMDGGPQPVGTPPPLADPGPLGK